MISFLTYSPDGRIFSTGAAANTDAAEAQAFEGYAVLLDVEEEVHPNTHRVDLGVSPPVPVLKTPVPYSLSGTTLTGLPVATLAVFEGQMVTVVDTILALDIDLPGTYDLVLQHPLYLNTLVSVEVV